MLEQPIKTSPWNVQNQRLHYDHQGTLHELFFKLSITLRIPAIPIITKTIHIYIYETHTNLWQCSLGAILFQHAFSLFSFKNSSQWCSEILQNKLLIRSSIQKKSFGFVQSGAASQILRTLCHESNHNLADNAAQSIEKF